MSSEESESTDESESDDELEEEQHSFDKFLISCDVWLASSLPETY